MREKFSLFFFFFFFFFLFFSSWKTEGPRGPLLFFQGSLSSLCSQARRVSSLSATLMVRREDLQHIAKGHRSGDQRHCWTKKIKEKMHKTGEINLITILTKIRQFADRNPRSRECERGRRRANQKMLGSYLDSDDPRWWSQYWWWLTFGKKTREPVAFGVRISDEGIKRRWETINRAGWATEISLRSDFIQRIWEEKEDESPSDSPPPFHVILINFLFLFFSSSGFKIPENFFFFLIGGITSNEATT